MPSASWKLTRSVMLKTMMKPSPVRTYCSRIAEYSSCPAVSKTSSTHDCREKMTVSTWVRHDGDRGSIAPPPFLLSLPSASSPIPATLTELFWVVNCVRACVRVSCVCVRVCVSVSGGGAPARATNNNNRLQTNT